MPIGEPLIHSLFGDTKISNSVFDILSIIAIFVYTTFSYSTAGQAPVGGPTGFGQGPSSDSISLILHLGLVVLQCFRTGERLTTK